MSNGTISRRDFLKGLGAAAAAAGITAITGCGSNADTGDSSSEASASSSLLSTEAAAASATAAATLNAVTGEMSYTPGTYSASARGMESDVKVTMTFDDTSITDVQIDVSGETEGVGAAIGDEVTQQVLDAQGAEIDGVSGATVTSTAVRQAVADCISQASGRDVNEILGKFGSKDDTSSSSASADWLGSAPEIAESDISSEKDCDVLVIGAGSSGSFAAASAAEEGAKVIVIEKYDHDHASGIRDTLAAINSSEQQDDGDNVDRDTAVNYICNWSQGYTRRSLCAEWADNSGEVVDWFRKVLQAGGIDFRHEIDDQSRKSNYEFLDVGHSVQYDDSYYEQQTMDMIFDYEKNTDLTVDYETTMVKLEQDKDGRVTGVIAQDKDGSYIRYNASKGVIVATGGYSNNADMLAALQPWTNEQTAVNYSKAGSTGDGIRALLWLGAKMDTVHTSMIFDRGAVKPDEKGTDGAAVKGALFWMGSQPFLKVNLNGERFMCEYQPYDYILHQAAMQPAHTYATVWDSSYAEDIKRFDTHGCSRLYPHENGTAPVFSIEYIEEMNKGLLDDGYIVQADTIEELAEKLGLPVDTFKAAVERYNTLAENGRDIDFGKESYRLSTLSEPPYYGVRQCGGYLICTMDGIQMDDNFHPVNNDGTPIEGCYVIGDCSGNYFAGSYPNLAAGAAAGRSATFGWLAGKNAVKGI